MFKYKIFFSLGDEDKIHGVEFMSAREVSDAYIYLLIKDICEARDEFEAIDIKRKVCTPLNETIVTDIY